MMPWASWLTSKRAVPSGCAARKRDTARSAEPQKKCKDALPGYEPALGEYALPVPADQTNT